MTERRLRNTPLANQLLLILLAALLVYLVVSFARQVGASQQRRRELQDVQSAIDAVEQDNEELAQYLEHTQSDAAVEKWMRTHGAARDDQVLVVPVGWGEMQVQGEREDSETGAVQTPSRSSWWDLFFGKQ